jgi:hypothetical protein
LLCTIAANRWQLAAFAIACALIIGFRANLAFPTLLFIASSCVGTRFSSSADD